MAKLPYRTTRNYKPGDGQEKSKNPSMTIPGESRSIQDIIKMYRKGETPEVNYKDFMDVEDVDNINHYFAPGALDLTDLQALRDRSRIMENTLKKAVEAKKKEEEDRKKQEEIEKEAEKRIANREKEKNEKKNKKDED